MLADIRHKSRGYLSFNRRYLQSGAVVELIPFVIGESSVLIG
jgi:hypothetical protein